jgi:glycine cleavage system aminomethyltransferase T
LNGPSLQDGIDKAGNAVRMLWRPNSSPPAVPVLPAEIDGWSKEQAAWRSGVAFFDLSHHMIDLFIDGPDASNLLSAVSANNYTSFEVGRARQFVPVTAEGHIVTDGILFRLGEHSYDLVCIGAAQNWVMYHAQKLKSDVRLKLDLASDYRQGPPVFFRYQVQGPKAAAVIERVLDAPVPGLKFLHFGDAKVAGKAVKVFRHGMAGQPGLEFFGPWEDGELVKKAILKAGEALNMAQVGGLAYYTTGIESGWIPTPLPGIYTSSALEEYRRSVSLYSYEGMNALQGSFYSERAEDYYCSPYELGYGRSISLDHEFIGRAALERAQNAEHRVKVTLVWNSEDVDRVFGKRREFMVSYTKDRVEHDGAPIGISMYAGSIAPAGTIYSLALIDKRFASVGGQVNVVWGQHPGHGAAPDVIDSFARIRTTVQPAPITEHARTTYRKD